MAKVTFNKSFLQSILWGENESVTMMENEITGHSRWSINYLLTFEHNGRYFQVAYSRGATEQQDEQPFEYEDDMIKCDEVEWIEVKKIVYRKLP